MWVAAGATPCELGVFRGYARYAELVLSAPPRRSSGSWAASWVSPDSSGGNQSAALTVIALPFFEVEVIVSKRGKIIVLHFAGQMPLAGIAWQAMHYLLGLEQLGYEAWYVEDGGANPYDPRVNSVVMECDYNVAFLGRMMERYGFGQRWSYWDAIHDIHHDLWPKAQDAPSCFTTIGTWENKGKNIEFDGSSYVWSKHVNFLQFLDLPQQRPETCFRLAMLAPDERVRSLVAKGGWSLVDPRPISADMARYRDFIASSRGEF